MIDKVLSTKPAQALDQSLICIGGWLRSIDTQIISFIRAEDTTFIKSNHYLYKHRWGSDVPEWVYQGRNAALNGSKGLNVKGWYKNLMGSAAWHTSRDWRSPLSELLLNQRFNTSDYRAGGLSLNYVYTSPVHSQIVSSSNSAIRAHQIPFSQYSEGLGQFWSTSYQFSTALALLLPLAVNITQSPSVPEFLGSVSHGIQSQVANLSGSFEAAQPKPTAALTVKMNHALHHSSKPTGKIANIQSYTLPAKGAFTSGYGMRWGRTHRGIDLAAPIGTPIVAAAAGKVVTAGWSEDGFGNKVEIQHPDGTITLYAHSSRILTRVGAIVHQGQQIAEVGTSGFSTGPHLHFQIHPKGKEAIDPLFFFSNNKALMSMKPASGT
jgi:murein DD-endopeptidase MepM/ murein hydrolase activator NlpD